jgi:hypothetical protein
MAHGPSSTLDTDAARVRLVLIRELETISVYEALAREASSEDARAFFEHLAREEKEHVAEATWLLRRLDRAQDADFLKPFSAEHFGPRAPAPVVETAPAATARSDDADLRPGAKPFIPESHRLPSDPRRTVHALPAAQGTSSGAFTVGNLKQQR